MNWDRYFSNDVQVMRHEKVVVLVNRARKGILNRNAPELNVAASYCLQQLQLAQQAGTAVHESDHVVSCSAGVCYAWHVPTDSKSSHGTGTALSAPKCSLIAVSPYAPSSP